MKATIKPSEREQFILDWLRDNPYEGNADPLNAQFHEAYHARFPMYARRETFWGAAPVAQATRDVKRLFEQGLLEVRRVGLRGVWQPGFPTWVNSYSLKRG